MCLLDCQRRMLQHLPFLLLKMFLHRHSVLMIIHVYLLNVKILLSSSLLILNLCILCIIRKISSMPSR